MRLGEAMVKAGLITNDILARALERQIIFGGRLGTNLVEMGAISEENLAKFLSKTLHVPYAEPAQFENIPQETLDAFPGELASKYTAFPIRMERSRIHLAMKDPNDFAALDDIRFITGLDPRAYIASEIRIVFALEKYYGIKRDLRYISLLDEDKPEVPPAMRGTAFVPPAASFAPKPAQKPPQPEPVPEQFLGDESQVNIYSMPASALSLGEEVAPPATKPQPVEPPPVKVARPEPVQAPGEAPKIFSPYESLASPADRDHIAEALIAAALMHVTRAALFLVKGSVATGWKAGGAGLDNATVSSVSVGLEGQSIFKGVVEEKTFYKGPVLRVPQNVNLLDSLGGVYPQEAVVYPLIIRGKVVGVLYGDNGQDSIIRDVDELIGIMSKGSMSLEILILKNKILG